MKKRNLIMPTLLLLAFASLSCGPRTSEEYREEAMDRMTQEDYEGAIRYYRKAITLEENETEKGRISCEIGLALYQLYQYAHAIEAIEQGLRLCPDYSTAYGVLGLSYYYLDPVTYRDRVRNNLQEYIRREPDNLMVPNFQEILHQLEAPPAAGKADSPGEGPEPPQEEE